LPDSPEYKKARELAERIVVELNYTIITGGGPGIMEAANRGAFESGGVSVGLSIDLPHEQIVNPYLNHHLNFYYFFSRKVCLSFAAEAYIFFPGGFGTLDEFFEIICLIQTRKIETVPIILVGSEYWKKYDALFRDTLLKKGLIDSEDVDLFKITDDDDEIINIIRHSPVRNGIKFEHPGLPPKLAAMNISSTSEEISPLSKDEVKKLLDEVPGWHFDGSTHLEKIFHKRDFKDALNFIDNIGKLAEEVHHHPDISISDYNKVTVRLSTHSAKGVTARDFVMAAKIEEIV
jgi:uncharacterized protein (TIGR00730 family)